MKITFTSTYDKKLKYKIYEPNGKKRKLLAKGKFLHSTETEVNTTSGNIIVRVTAKRNIFKYILAILRMFFRNYLLSWNALGSDNGYLEVNNFDEILIKKVNSIDDICVRYNLSPLIDRTYENPASTAILVDYLTCDTHSYIKETAKNNRTSSFYMLLLFSLLICFVAVTSCLVIFC